MILVIDNYDSFTFNLVQYLGQMTDVQVVRNDVLTSDDIRELHPSGIVISPGPGRPESAGVSLEVIRNLGREVPILGVCLGHQAIAEAYGGEVVKAVRLMHGKADTISHSGEGLFRNLPHPLVVGRYHSLVVDISRASRLKVDAISDDGTIMAVSHQEYPVYGLQFHPESILTPQGRTMVANFVDLSLGTDSASSFLNVKESSSYEGNYIVRS